MRAGRAGKWSRDATWPWAQYPTEAPVIASVKPSTCFMPKLRFGFLQTLRLFGLPRFG